MVRYIIKRILVIPLILLAVSLLIFMLVNISNVDPARQILGSDATVEDLDAVREGLGLNDPLIVQYYNYMKNIITKGDFGNSWYTGNAVLGEITQRLPVTAQLALITTVLMVIIGLPLGILCAVKQYTIVDGLINFISKLLGGMPNFWAALMLMLLFSLYLGWLPAYGIATWRHWIMPVATLTLQSVGMYLRMTRSSMLDSVRQDYVRTARAKGCSERTVIYKHALRNALLPLVTMTGQYFATMMGGALVVETVFAIPGLGSFVISAVQMKDVPIVVGCTLFLTIIFLSVSLVIDLLYVVVDPRVKATFVSAKKSKPVVAKEVA